jgi:hypothetical protein
MNFVTLYLFPFIVWHTFTYFPHNKKLVAKEHPDHVYTGRLSSLPCGVTELHAAKEIVDKIRPIHGIELFCFGEKLLLCL